MELLNLSLRRGVAEWLPEINLEELAVEVGWQKRRGKKLSARKWVAALMGCVWQSGS
jgi:hypothetical protein